MVSNATVDISNCKQIKDILSHHSKDAENNMLHTVDIQSKKTTNNQSKILNKEETKRYVFNYFLYKNCFFLFFC